MERADGRRGDPSHSCGRIRASRSRADSTPAIAASDANMPGLPIRLIAAPASRSAAAGLRRAAHARGGRAVPWDGPRLAGQGGAVPGGRLRTASGEERSRWLDAWPWWPAEAGRGGAGLKSTHSPPAPAGDCGRLARHRHRRPSRIWRRGQRRRLVFAAPRVPKAEAPAPVREGCTTCRMFWRRGHKMAPRSCTGRCAAFGIARA